MIKCNEVTALPILLEGSKCGISTNNQNITEEKVVLWQHLFSNRLRLGRSSNYMKTRKYTEVQRTHM